jgi:hypothetical protein
VSFHAKGSGIRGFCSGTTITFDSVQCNNGGGYNSSDGVFTAPQAGTYVFMATVWSESGNNGIGNSRAGLYVKGSDWARMVTCQSSTMHATVSLLKGEQVWVQSLATHCWCNADVSYFSGALVAC